MKRKPNFFRGFFRLGATFFVLFWVGISWWTWTDELNARNRHILPHFHESVDCPTGWLTEIAKDEFLALSADERQAFAKAYFEKNIEGLAREEFYDTNALRDWFIKTAQLTLEQAPIKERRPFDNTPSYIVRFRNIPIRDMPTQQIWRPFILPESMAIALGAALISTVGLAGSFFVVRWVCRGFSSSGIADMTPLPASPNASSTIH